MSNADSNVVVLDNGTLGDFIKSDGEIIAVDFYAHWCGPCKFFANFYDELSLEMSNKSIRFGKIEIEGNQGVAQKYNIRGVPTFKLFKDGKEVVSVSGPDAFPKDKIEKLIMENLS